MWILDSDHLTLLEYSGSPAAERLRRRLLELPPDTYGTTIVNYEEQCHGWLEFIKQKKLVLEQVTGYQKLHKQLLHYCGIKVTDFDEMAAIEFQRLRSSKVRIKTTDLKIAAIALSRNATLLTRNLRDFIRVPGLRFEDWTKEVTS